MVDAATFYRLVGMPTLMFMPFHVTHIDRLDLTDYDVQLMSSLANFRERCEQVAREKTAWTIFHEGSLAMVFGIEEKWDGVAEIWMVPGKYALKKGHILTRGTKRLFDRLGPELHLRRLQIVVSVEHKPAIQWAEFLRFEREGVMRKYGPEGADYYMYARIY